MVIFWIIMICTLMYLTYKLGQLIQAEDNEANEVELEWLKSDYAGLLHLVEVNKKLYAEILDKHIDDNRSLRGALQAKQGNFDLERKENEQLLSEIEDLKLTIENNAVGFNDCLRDLTTARLTNGKLHKENTDLESEIESLEKLLASKMDLEKEINAHGYVVTKSANPNGTNGVVDLGDKTNIKRGWRADWKVTPKMKIAIKKSKGTQEQIAKRFNISRSRVGQIRREK